VKDVDLLTRVVLEDILDEAILLASPGERSYPLRVLFSTLRDRAPTGEAAFELASALNVYFRVPMEEETKMRLGLEVSRIYYQSAVDLLGENERVALTSPLLATLMSNELERLRFEAVDGVRVFDSAVHERDPDADGASAEIVTPRTFLVRVAATDKVRARALVRT
jgi:hypothetical protein